jgi:1,4-dihydroxy-2-naphthoate polyprenyltransferase
MKPPPCARTMQGGQVRAVLWQHLGQRRGGPARPRGSAPGPVAVPATATVPPTAAPTALVPVDGFRDALSALDPNAQRAAAHDYIALWARTFPTLVRHLRGRPRATLRLWCTEVYPYLRGQRRAARIDSWHGRTAQVTLADDLPAPYLCGLVAAFMGLSHAHADVERTGPETFHLTYQVHPGDRFATLVQAMAYLRVPLLVTAGLAVVVAGALAAAHARWLDGAIMLAGILAAQAAANALQSLRSPTRGPLDASSPPAIWRRAILLAGYIVAAASMVYLAWIGRPWVLAFAVVGLGASLLYTRVRDWGLGPLFAGFVHGPMVMTGAYYALAGMLPPMWDLLLFSLPVGLLTAAIVYLDDVADRPLDEASGKRTLAVRLPQPRHLIGFVALAGVGLAVALVLAARVQPVVAVLLGGITIPVLLVLSRTVQRNLDEPRRLASARLGTLGLHAAASTALCIILWSLP